MMVFINVYVNGFFISKILLTEEGLLVRRFDWACDCWLSVHYNGTKQISIFQ